MKITPNYDNVRVSGRCTILDNVLYLGFSGAFCEFKTLSDKLVLSLVSDDPIMREDPKSEWYRPEVAYCDDTYYGHLAVIIDGDTDSMTRIALKEPKMTVSLDLPSGEHTVRLLKLNEAAFGLVGIAEIEVDDSGVTKTEPLSRKIEFVGDSITCGYGNEGVNGVDIFSTHQQNPVDAYAIKTARALKAEYQLVSWSGIGIITNYVDADKDGLREEILMPWLYPYRDRRLCERKNLPLEEWDFASYVPDVVVMFLGTNDASYTRGKEDREEYFAENYLKFLDTLHEKNPGSAILSILGTMEKSLCQTEAKKVEEWKKAHPDVKIDFLDLPFQDEKDGIGTDGHPSKVTHEKVSKLLEAKLREMMGWNS